jgi:hypothetical protein
MSNVNCPYCQRANRPGARFCVACGRDMGRDAQTAVNPNLVHKAAAAAAPVVQQAAAAGWSQSKRGAGWLRRVLTLGGRAAYTELFSPEPATAGWIINLPQLRTVPAAIEVSFFLFVVFLLFGWLLVFLPGPWPAVTLAGWLLLLLILNFAGVKRPYFTTTSLYQLWGRPSQVQAAEFYMQEMGSNRQLRVELIDLKQSPTLQPGLYLQVYGVVNGGQAAVRAWWLSATSQDGQTQQVVQAARLIPLSVALFLPWLLALAALLTKLLWIWFHAP